MIYIKKLVLIVSILILFVLFLNGSYALWRHNTEVKFTLTISQPEEDYSCCICGKYSTAQEGMDLLINVQYPKIFGKMEQFKNQLYARANELDNLPFGSITYDELKAETDHYRNVDIKAFGNCINTYGDCIDTLGDFYDNLSEEEKNQIPDFWDELSGIWNLHSQLWTKRGELYTAVDAVWEAGHRKIDYDNSYGKDK